MNDQLQKLEPRKMSDPAQLQEALVLVINLLAQQASLIEALRQEDLALDDEINRLRPMRCSRNTKSIFSKMFVSRLVIRFTG